MQAVHEKKVRSVAGEFEGVLQLYQGDITSQTVDALVNAANSRLAGGGGVDGAIHRRGGGAIMAETQRLYPQGCPTGAAVISSAGHLSARYVIHAVGPFWNGGQHGESELLHAAYHNSLLLAAQHDCRSIAFPSISTGAYRYPIDQAAEVALRCCWDFLRGATSANSLTEIRFVLFDASALHVFCDRLVQL